MSKDLALSFFPNDNTGLNLATEVPNVGFWENI